MPGDESRIDPEDGEARTLQEFRDWYQDAYSTSEVVAYWQDCKVADSVSRAPSVMEDLGRIKQEGDEVAQKAAAEKAAEQKAREDAARQQAEKDAQDKEAAEEAVELAAAQADVGEPRERAAAPCSNYQVDIKSSAGDCAVCGHPKEAHIRKGSNPAARALGALKKEDVPVERQAKPCSNYVVDTAADVYGTCRCGHPKAAHFNQVVNKAEEVKAAHDAKILATQTIRRSEGACQPCSKFKADLTAEGYGMCKCGHPQSAHEAFDHAADLQAKRAAKEQEETERREASRLEKEELFNSGGKEGKKSHGKNMEKQPKCCIVQ